MQEMERGFLEGKTGKLLDLKELLCVWNWCEEKKMEDDVKESEVGVVGVERERESEAIVVSSSLRLKQFCSFLSYPLE